MAAAVIGNAVISNAVISNSERRYLLTAAPHHSGNGVSRFHAVESHAVESHAVGDRPFGLSPFGGFANLWLCLP